MSVTKPETEKKAKGGNFKLLMQRLGAWVHGSGLRCLLMMLAGCAVLFALCCAVCVSNRYSLEVGDVSDRNIAATKDVEDVIATREAQEKALSEVKVSYNINEGAVERVQEKLAIVFTQLQAVREYGENLRVSTGADSDTFSNEDVQIALSMVTTPYITLNEEQARLWMGMSGETFANIQADVDAAVTTAMDKRIIQGQELAAVNSIVSARAEQYKTWGYDKLPSVFIGPLLNAVMEPTEMLDAEATEAARARALASVTPVIYKQGQYIVREGERVNANQLEMLGELGLLTSSEFNFSVYGGALLLVVSAMAVLWLLLQLLEPSALRSVRTLVVIMLVMAISEALSVLSITLINAYLSPVALCAILLTGLLGPRIGAAAGLTMTIIIAGLSAASSNAYSNEMVCLMLTGLVGTVVAVQFLAGKPQRVGAVICGVLVALANLLVMLAIGLMTAVHLGNTIYQAVWMMAGGVLSGLIAVGFQPVFEAIFNLATPSKLMELANPNHPLLRRLLMEAPGTYHHSIIVANLAEAAAERIGANMLLARTGAYFHDVGKLKRPMYFKENQHGDNPHDRTTAHLSAAIVTAHTTDGLRMAQKHRLPVEIQRIIVEHHGDTPVMYFYHKALQQADGKPVDVKDFRYNGNRPSTKEGAIVMLADTIEAAVRSMSEPTPQAIAQFIERLVRGKIEDGQLSDSPLSLKDIDGISDAFIKVLRGVFHERIEYPTMHIDRRDDENAATKASDGMAAPYSAPMPDGMVPPAAGEEKPAREEGKK